MEITEIRIFPKEGQDKKLKAYATVTFDDAFVVRNIKVIQISLVLRIQNILSFIKLILFHSIY